MFGFLIGTLSLVGLIKVVRGGHRWGGGYGRHGGPRQWMLRRLFQRLDTTHGQEKVILEVSGEVETAGRAVREEFLRARGEYAKAMRAEHFDGEAVRAAFEKQQATLEELKKAMLGGMQKVHEALTAEQRAQVADLIEYGPRGGHGHCGRHHHHGLRGHGHFGGHQPGAVNL